MTPRKHLPWWRAHSLSVVIGVGVIVWATLYEASDPKSHIGVFYGNSIADWLGSFVTVVATKFWYEKGSVESRLPPKWRHRVPDWVEDHSLSLVLVVSWIMWIAWYVRIDPDGRTGEVVGNIVSEWGQILSLVWFTKYLYERGSKESR